MKIFKRLSALIVAGLLTASCAALAGCGDDTDKTERDLTGNVLLSFETATELQTMTLYRGIDKAELNKDEKYITEGKRSLRICPRSEAVNGVYEDSYIAFLGSGKCFEKTNFDDVDYISVDIYNATAADVKVVWGVRGNDSDSYTVKSGWNTLYKYIDREMLYANNQGYVEMISFFFEGRGESDGKLDVYMDNIRYYTATDGYEKLSLGSKEVINFENKVERTVFSVEKKSGVASAECILSINTDLRYVKTGTSSLKVTAGTSTAQAADKPVLKALSDNLPDFSKYLNNGWYFTMPVFNDSIKTIRCSLQFTTALEDYYLAFEIAPHSWGKESEKISLDLIKSQFAGEGLDIQSIIVKFEGLNATDSVYIDRIGLVK